MKKLITFYTLSLLLVVSYAANGEQRLERIHNSVGTWNGTCEIVSEAGFTSIEVFAEITDQEGHLFNGYMRIGPETQDLDIYGVVKGRKVFATRRAQVISGEFKEGHRKLHFIVHETRVGIPSHGE